MCVACCDPTKIEQPAAPNCARIPASSSIVYTTKRDALVIVTGEGHYTGTGLSVTRNDQSVSADSACRFMTQGRASAFIPGAGTWRIFNSGASAVNIVVVDAYCGAAFRAFVRTGYGVAAHSTIALNATPASTIVLAANQLASYRLIQAPATNTVSAWLSFGPAATASAGIEMVPGERYEMAGDNLWRGVINAILAGATASQTLLVTEGS